MEKNKKTKREEDKEEMPLKKKAKIKKGENEEKQLFFP